MKIRIGIVFDLFGILLTKNALCVIILNMEVYHMYHQEIAKYMRDSCGLKNYLCGCDKRLLERTLDERTFHENIRSLESYGKFLRCEDAEKDGFFFDLGIIFEENFLAYSKGYTDENMRRDFYVTSFRLLKDIAGEEVR